jgi:hypothetical protein
MRRRLRTILLALAVAAVPTAAAPGDPAPAAPAAHAQEAQREAWTQRLNAAVMRAERAKARHDKAMDAYSHMRSRRRARGSEKQAIMDELTASDLALSRAEEELRELRATARRAGVPPGWFRDAGADRSPPPARPDDAAP